MGWKKWLLIGLVFFIPFIGPFLAAFLIAGNWVLIGFKVYFILLYLTIRIPIWLFVEIPLWYVGKATRSVEDFFKVGYASVLTFPKSAITLFLLLAAFLSFIFPVSLGLELLTQPTQILANLGSLIFLLVATTGVLFGMFNTYMMFKGIDVVSAHFGGKAEAIEAASGAAVKGAKEYKKYKEGDSAINTAEETGKGVYNNIEASDAMGGAGTVALSAKGLPGDMAKILGEAPFSQAILGEGTLAGAPLIEVILMVILFFIFYFLTAGVFGLGLYILTIVGVVFFNILSPILSPVMGALGYGADLGSAYGDWFGTEFSNQYLAGVDLGETVEPAVDAYTQARARVFCLLKGPACLRAQMINNTERPGSEERGQTYGLEVERFTIGRDQIDVRNSPPGQAVPVSFTIANPRHGLKGIDALDVQYRIQMIDAQRGKDRPYCDTGWLNIDSAYNINGEPSNVKNDIYPGTSATTGYLVVDQDHIDENSPEFEQEYKTGPLTLQNCEMLQPGAGSTKTAILYLKYDYFSQATLAFDAMSFENFQSNPEAVKDMEESYTADTPVKAAINVNAPVTFRQGTDSLDTTDVLATLNTDDESITYAVNGMKIRSSSYLEPVEEASVTGEDRDCSFIQLDGSPLLGLSEKGENQIIKKYGHQTLFTGSTPENWYNQEFPAPLIGCTMEVVDKNQLNPAGETLTMGIASNYTVVKEDRIGQIRVLNRICSTGQCPLLVSLSDNESEQDYNFRTTCEGVDVADEFGCTAVKYGSITDWLRNYQESDGRGVVSTNRPANGDHVDTYIEDGEVVLELNPLAESGAEIYGDTSTPMAGFEKDEWKRIDRDLDGEIDDRDEWDGVDNYAIVQYVEARGEEVDVEFQILDENTCDRSDVNKRPGYNIRIHKFVTTSEECSESSSGDGGGDGSDVNCNYYPTERSCNRNAPDACSWNGGACTT